MYRSLRASKVEWSSLNRIEAHTAVAYCIPIDTLINNNGFT